MKKITILIAVVLSFFYLFSFQSFGQEATKKSAKADKSGPGGDKKQAYMGDPAMKRGFILGYDEGVKAGKEDKKNGKRENPSSREEYKMGEKKYRSEYGSSAKFVGGYQGGFLKGYKSGYNREKINPEAAKLSKMKEKEKPAEKKAGNPKNPKNPLKSDVKQQTPQKPKARKPTPADDAL